MKCSFGVGVLLVLFSAAPPQAATWGAEAAFGALIPGITIAGKAKVEDGVYTEESVGGAVPSRVSDGTVQVSSTYGGARASIEEGRVKLDGFGPSGAVTFGGIFDTLTNFQPKGDLGFSLAYRLEFEVDPFEFPNLSDVPIALLSLSIRGGGVSSGFAIPIFGCIYTNACATSDVIRFPKDTEKIEIGFSLSAFSESTGRPVIHDYYANLRMGVAEFCEVDGVFKTCAVPYDSASNRWLQNVVPLPVPVPVPSAIVLLAGGLAGLAVVARRRRPSQGLPIR